DRDPVSGSRYAALPVGADRGWLGPVRLDRGGECAGSVHDLAAFCEDLTVMAVALRIDPRRRAIDMIMRGLCWAAAIFSSALLVVLLFHVAVNGASALSLELVTSLPAALGDPGGGIVHAIAGSVIMVGIGCLGAIPVGIGAGIFLSEYS